MCACRQSVCGRGLLIVCVFDIVGHEIFQALSLLSGRSAPA